MNDPIGEHARKLERDAIVAREPLWHSRTLPDHYCIKTEYQPFDGARALSIPHVFYRDAVDELSKHALIEVSDDFKSYKVLGGNFRIAYIPKIFRYPQFI